MAQTLSARRLADLLGPLDHVGPAYREIADRLRLLVVDGRVADGSRLPSERELATALGVSRTTTTRVFAELRDSGLLQSRRGSGSIVRVPLSTSSASSLIVTPDSSDTIAMTYAAPIGPPGLTRAFETAVAKLPGLLATTGYLPDGLPVLREVLAQRYTDGGLPTEPGQIIVTSGAMGAISLLARTLVSPGQRVVVEGMGYPHAHDSFVAAGARLSPLPVDRSPWDTEALAAVLSGAPHRAALIVPDFHNPTAAIMGDAERHEWARQLRRHDVVPVVDESLREINLDGVELPPVFATYDPRALLIGSSSKAYWGGLRVGWIRAPRDAVMPLVQARMMDDLGSSAFDQLVLSELLVEGGQTAAAGRSRLRAGRDHLLSELARELPDVHAPCPAGGLSLWVTLPERMSSRLTSAAARHGLLLTPGPRFVTRPGTVGERHLRLPYNQSHETLTEAVSRLRAAYDEVTDTGTVAPSSTAPSKTLEMIA
ncbi:MocR-like transcription factor YczR [Aeromicrobium fastidiosum]|uniref:PLP-dependent aminotransferase family protein n=1 Tax=Aeromicrobium fastidiosum TaxID=52699 RepID=A0A641AIC8_9ACTN|nr:PLP-dependent aminotransferase family protein [Aeromicrobium fastidiosum]KAA1372464.1 PLP-dependent aminotransferase family protein [Aeromicrobium fastidiosum]MBP2391458.1 DNA-binding transcriptional MocR family regulator [Aeromicrobium fastidiosum]